MEGPIWLVGHRFHNGTVCWLGVLCIALPGVREVLCSRILDLSLPALDQARCERSPERSGLMGSQGQPLRLQACLVKVGGVQVESQSQGSFVSLIVKWC